MSYRKINVNGRIYEWVAGKQFLKIKNFGIFPIKDIGNPVGGDRYVVSTGNVRAVILGLEIPTFSCDHGTNTIELRDDPFSYEIYGKTRLVLNCPTCLKISAFDI